MLFDRTAGWIDTLLSTRLFTFKQVFLLASGFVAAVIFSNIIVTRVICRVVEFSSHRDTDPCPFFWPLSRFQLRSPGWDQLLIAIALMALCYFALRQLPKIRYGLPYVVIIGIVLIFGTNLMQALGGDELIPPLIRYGTTHPPAWGLVAFKLVTTIGPDFTAVVVTILAATLSPMFFHGLISRDVGAAAANYMTFLFILLPPIQIYYLVHFDALFVSLLLGSLYFFRHPRLTIGVFGSLTMLFLASSMNFLFLFLLPVLAGYEALVERRLTRSACIFAGLALLYLLAYLIFDSNYLDSLTKATAFEGPIELLTRVPYTYLLTRLEGVFEIAVFFGPFLMVLAVLGMVKMRRDNRAVFWWVILGGVTLLAAFVFSSLWAATFQSYWTSLLLIFSVLFAALSVLWLALAKGGAVRGFVNQLRPIQVGAPSGNNQPFFALPMLGVITLLVMFAAGVFRTGETARSGLFIYPYLLLPVAAYLESIDIKVREKFQLVALVFTQTILMQLFGFYWA